MPSAGGAAFIGIGAPLASSPHPLREKLAAADPAERLRLAAWMMREARVDQAWQFLTLAEVAASFSVPAPNAWAPAQALAIPPACRP